MMGRLLSQLSNAVHGCGGICWQSGVGWRWFSMPASFHEPGITSSSVTKRVPQLPGQWNMWQHAVAGSGATAHESLGEHPIQHAFSKTGFSTSKQSLVETFR